MKPKFCKFIAFIVILLILGGAGGCRTLFVDNPEKKAAKKQQKDFRENAKSYRASVKDHYDNQSKKTKRRMKKT